MEGRLQTAWRTFLDAAEREHHRLEQQPPSSFPHYTDDGTWRYLEIEHVSRWAGDTYDHGNWTAGFSLGVQWLLWQATRSPQVHETCRVRLERLAPRAEDATTHDLGFLFHPSFVLGHALGALSSHDAKPAITAANTLARRFNHAGGFIQAFGAIGDSRSAGTSTIDTMMNLPLLWWAASNGADASLAHAARRHARTSARLFFRPDGSTYHLMRFDPISGALLQRGTFQGSNDDSCWSRGQAWAVAGFAWAYGETCETEFLETAERAASYFLDHLPSSSIPPWDFADLDQHAATDASAAAIVALGLVLLAHLHPDKQRAEKHAQTAESLLFALHEAAANTSPGIDGILLASSYSVPHGLGLRGAVGWGDYYYGLALAIAVGAVSPRLFSLAQPAIREDVGRARSTPA